MSSAFDARLARRARLGLMAAAVALLALVALLPGTRSGQAFHILYVPVEYPTIQAAINGAVDGKNVQVAPGTYYENLDFKGKAINVYSEGGPGVTIIDGSAANSVVSIYSGEDRSSVLDGFTIRNGRSDFSDPGYGDGGGIWVYGASPTIRNNVIADNDGCSGIGISVDNGSPLIERNLITGNVQTLCSGGSGAGILIEGVSFAEIRHNIVADNLIQSGFGGGISLYNSGPAVVEDNVIARNTATGVSPCAWGGGVAVINDSPARIVANLIIDNGAGCGGGVFLYPSTGPAGPTLVNNSIAGNDAAEGSAVFSRGDDAQVALWNNLLVGRAGQPAVYCSGLGDAGTPLFRANDTFSPATAAYSGVCPDATGSNGNISADPLFADPPNGDYHLQPASPAVDAGDNGAPDAPALDVDRQARPMDGDGDALAVIDMGIDEVKYGAGDTDGDGKPNSVDADDDADGCLDEQELGLDPTFGGGRDPHYFWDFFDVPAPPSYARDRVIAITDIVALVGRFGSTGSVGIDPLSQPPPAPGYHTAYDRTFVQGKLAGPPDGAISVADVVLAVAQFGQHCA